MATTTTNLGLTKPSGTDKIRIAQINGNMDILDDKIGAVGNTSLQAQVASANQAIENVQNGLAYIVGNTNTTGSTLAVGQFVYVKGHSTIAEGLYMVTASISANGSITTSNTSACTGGGLNELNSKFQPYTLLTTTDNVSIAASGNYSLQLGANTGKFKEYIIMWHTTNQYERISSVFPVEISYVIGYENATGTKIRVENTARSVSALKIENMSTSQTVYIDKVYGIWG